MEEIINPTNYKKIFLVFLAVGLALQFFMHSYLLKKKAIDRSLPGMLFSSVIFFKFRDYTKKNNSILHLLYYVEIVLIISVFAWLIMAGIFLLTK
ncbi:MAG TPA: hypothetical protein DCX54_11775 [Flavobacteriales bacterium]|nr:hypothetical protein [Flavobacteriales bacterium]